jgi:AraC-like DNA-binding protein/mannose-6-phosphate isomerase-like protein (cupin superfamily)
VTLLITSHSIYFVGIALLFHLITVSLENKWTEPTIIWTKRAIQLMQRLGYVIIKVFYVHLGEEAMMFNHNLPSGLEHSIYGTTLPDLQFSFQFYAAHRRKVDRHWSFPTHEHSVYEINIVLEGTQKMQVAKNDYLQDKDSMILVLPGVKHASLGVVGETMEYFCLHFDTDDLGVRQQLNHFHEVMYPMDSSFSKRIRPAINELLETAACDLVHEYQIRPRMLHAAFQLFSSIIEMATQQKEPASKLSTTAHLAERIADSIEKMVMQPLKFNPLDNERIGIEKMAEQMGYSSAYCNRVFRNAYGISPRQFMTTLQLRQARLLLINEKLSIEQIAIMLGYRDIAHFSKQFKRWMNISPSAYRQLSH